MMMIFVSQRPRVSAFERLDAAMDLLEGARDARGKGARGIRGASWDTNAIFVLKLCVMKLPPHKFLLSCNNTITITSHISA